MVAPSLIVHRNTDLPASIYPCPPIEASSTSDSSNESTVNVSTGTGTGRPFLGKTSSNSSMKRSLNDMSSSTQPQQYEVESNIAFECHLPVMQQLHQHHTASSITANLLRVAPSVNIIDGNSNRPPSSSGGRMCNIRRNNTAPSPPTTSSMDSTMYQQDGQPKQRRVISDHSIMQVRRITSSVASTQHRTSRLVETISGYHSGESTHSATSGTNSSCGYGTSTTSFSTDSASTNSSCNSSNTRSSSSAQNAHKNANQTFPTQQNNSSMPHEYLLELLHARGIKAQVLPCNSPALESFFQAPTKHDLESYSKEVVGALRSQDVNTLKMLQDTQHVSMQCCNKFGEGLVHMACRRGYMSVMQFLLMSKADGGGNVTLQVKDDFGRTPAHDACWTCRPELDLMKIILMKAPDLIFVSDKRGHTPLQYVRREHAAQWRTFLFEHQHLLAPRHEAFLQKV